MSNEKRCLTCGETFTARGDALYCSGKCRQQAQRDRGKSDAAVVVGGVQGAVSAFSTTAGSFGEIGHAEITCTIRGTPQRDDAGRLPVALMLSDESLWAGDAEVIERNLDTGTVTVRARGLEGRLAAQMWTPEARLSLTAADFAARAAERAGLRYLIPEVPFDHRPLSRPEADDGGDTSGSRNALEVLLHASRELGVDFRVSADGALVFGPAPPAEPHVLAARNIRVTAFGIGAPVAVVGRSIPLHQVPGAPQPLRTGRLAEIVPGVPTYLVSMHGRRAPELEQIVERVTAEVSSGMLHVAAEVDDPVAVGTRVRIEAAADVPLLVVRVEHKFTADGGLQASIEALHLPRPTAISDAVPHRLPVQVLCPVGLAA